MVLGVCRRHLRDSQAVEDAFQATFLILVRRSGSIRPGRPLGPWLHGVARRVAMRAQGRAARRGMRETTGIEREPLDGSADSASIERRELRRVIDEELARLPESLRAPIVLCHLEGLTHEQAARMLACPVGTVHSRIARGRERLKVRLTRRGLAPALASGLLLGGEPVRAVVPIALVNQTVRMALAAWAPQMLAGTVPAAVALLASEVTRAMTFKTLTLFSATTLAAAGLMGGTAITANQLGASGDGPATATQVNPPPPVAVSPPFTKAQDASPAARIQRLEREKKQLVQELLELRRRLASLEVTVSGGAPPLEALPEGVFPPPALPAVAPVASTLEAIAPRRLGRTTCLARAKPAGCPLLGNGPAPRPRQIPSWRTIAGSESSSTRWRRNSPSLRTLVEAASPDPGRVPRMPEPARVEEPLPAPVAPTQSVPTQDPFALEPVGLEPQRYVPAQAEESPFGPSVPEFPQAVDTPLDGRIIQLNQNRVLTTTADHRRATVHDLNNGSRRSYDAPEGTTLYPTIVNGALLMGYKGDSVTEMAVYDNSQGKWLISPFENPVSADKLRCDASPRFVTYNSPYNVLLYDIHQTKWHNLILRSGQPVRTEVGIDSAEVRDGRFIHFFSLNVGKWVTMDTEAPDTEETGPVPLPSAEEPPQEAAPGGG